MSKPIFGYWNLRGLAGPIRNLLHYAGVDYEEKLYDDFETWAADKGSLGMDFPNLPYWIEKSAGGVKLTESKAVLKHVARQHAPDLMPKTNAELSEADMLEYFLVDMQTKLIFLAYGYTDEGAAQLAEGAKDKFQYLSKYLNGKKWIMGEKLSYLDFLLYDVLYFYKSYDSVMVEPYTVLKSFMKSFEALPAIAKYMASPNCITGPCVAEFAQKKF